MIKKKRGKDELIEILSDIIYYTSSSKFEWNYEFAIINSTHTKHLPCNQIVGLNRDEI